MIIGIVTIPVIVGIFIIVMFFASKRHVVSITPDGGKPIIFGTQGMKREFIDEFVDEVEAASMLLKGK